MTKWTASVWGFAGSWEDPLDVLVNNAGIMDVPAARTADGLDVQTATNYFGRPTPTPNPCHLRTRCTPTGVSVPTAPGQRRRVAPLANCVGQHIVEGASTMCCSAARRCCASCAVSGASSARSASSLARTALRRMT